MKPFLRKIDEGIDILSTILHHIANAVLCFIMVLISFDVIGRYFFNQPITGSFELTELGSAILVFFTFAIAHKYKEHIAIGFLVDKFPDKMKSVIEGAIELLVFVVIFLMSWQIYNDAVRMMGRGTTTSDLGLPVYPFIMLIGAGSFLFGLMALASSVKHFARVVHKQ
ncbi:TRAP transporter small permease [Salibacterium aidingense]|uniref:TRAP transporter small permease n=1 Tax=Salibacterium aidingense TaxID=384933 RepID=UPI00068493AF|nr:TRAP transporter small permease [Salibacterium aidingense]